MIWAPCSSGRWGDGGGVVGNTPHTHANAHTCMHAHACVVNMIISCKWPPPLGKSLGIPYDVIHRCMHIHVHVHICRVHPLTTSHPHPPSPNPRGDPWNQSKFNSTWTNRDISILFEDLKSVESPLPIGWCIVWLMGWWVGRLMGGVRSNH